jgi:hypothetical protein
VGAQVRRSLAREGAKSPQYASAAAGSKDARGALRWGVNRRDPSQGWRFGASKAWRVSGGRRQSQASRKPPSHATPRRGRGPRRGGSRRARGDDAEWSHHRSAQRSYGNE